MLLKIKDAISGFTKDSSTEDNSKEDQTKILNQACAALLIETAFADKEFSEEEKNSMQNTLRKTYKIEEQVIEDLIKDAEQIVAESTSLYEHTRLINDSCNYEDKLKLINGLWNLAFADQELDKYEEYLIRKIADLLHVSHSDFIKEKMKVKEGL